METKQEAQKTEAKVSPRADKRDWRYVTVPSVDIFADPHPAIRINQDTFGPGKHFVPPDIATELERIIEAKRTSDLRIVQPQRDLKLERMRTPGLPGRFTCGEES